MIRSVNSWRKATMNKGHIFTAPIIIALGILPKPAEITRVQHIFNT